MFRIEYAHHVRGDNIHGHEYATGITASSSSACTFSAIAIPSMVIWPVTAFQERKKPSKQILARGHLALHSATRWPLPRDERRG